MEECEILSVPSEKLMEAKINAYTEAAALFYNYMDLARKTKQGLSQKTINTLNKDIAAVGMKLSIFGSCDVVKKYHRHRMLSQGGGDAAKVVNAFVETMISMRKDLFGEAAGDLSVDEILSTFLVMDKNEAA